MRASATDLQMQRIREQNHRNKNHVYEINNNLRTYLFFTA